MASIPKSCRMAKTNFKMANTKLGFFSSIL